MSNIRMKPKHYLDDIEFKEYLSLVKKIGVFDPRTKEWVFNPEKIGLNFNSMNEFKSFLKRLEQYVSLSAEEKSIMIEEAKRYLTITVPLNLENFSFKLPRRIGSEGFKKILELCEYNKGVFYIKNPHEVEKVKELLESLGFRLDYDPSELEKHLKEICRCTVKREGGRIKIEFEHLFPVVKEKIKEACTLTYFVEKAILDEAGNFVETQLVERKMVIVDFDEKQAVTCVGLLDRVIDALKELSFDVKMEINELPDIPYEFKVNFKLLPHQEEAYKKWIEKKRGTIAIFTRGGKSFIAMQAIADLKKPTLILVTTRELAATWKNYLKKYLGLKPYHIGYLGEGEKNIKPVTVAIYNSAVRYIDLIKDKFEFVVFDEAHHVPANTFKEVALKVSALYRMALSATPQRRDRNEALLFALCGELLVNIDYAQLLALRIVAPIEEFKTFFVEGKEEKMEKLLEILRKCSGKKVIIFTQYIQTAQEIFNELARQGYKVAIITSETKDERRRISFEAFLKGLINIIVTTTVLDEGITVPDAEVAIIYEGSGEPRQMIQRIGRVLGYFPGKTAKVYEIVDITNIREKRAYFRRKWVKELYIVPELKRYLKVGGKLLYQARIEDYKSE